MVPECVDVRAPQVEERLSVGECLLRRAEALADDVSEVMIDHIVLGLDDLRETGRSLGLRHRRLDQKDVRSGRHRVGVLDVERRLDPPVGLVGITRVERRYRSGWGDDLERRRCRQAVGRIERRQVAPNRRRPVRVDDHDRLTRAGETNVVERVHVVGLLDLRRAVARDPDLHLALLRRRRLREMRVVRNVEWRRGRRTYT